MPARLLVFLSAGIGNKRNRESGGRLARREGVAPCKWVVPREGLPPAGFALLRGLSAEVSLSLWLDGAGADVAVGVVSLVSLWVDSVCSCTFSREVSVENSPSVFKAVVIMKLLIKVTMPVYRVKNGRMFS